MKGIIYVPYANGNCVTGFEYDKPLSAREYVRIETREYDDHYRGVDTMMRERYGENMSINMYKKRRFNCDKQDYAFHECDCNVFNIDGNNLSMEEIQMHLKNKDQFVLILNLNQKQFKENYDMVTDLNMWFNESIKVGNASKNGKRLSDIEVMKHLPKKDLKLKLNECNLTLLLRNCKFLKFRGSKTSFAIIVGRIENSK